MMKRSNTTNAYTNKITERTIEVAEEIRPPDNKSSTPDPVSETIRTIAELHARAEGRVGTHQRFLEQITLLIGRPRSVYLVVVFAVTWITVNLVLKYRLGKTFDEPPFFWLQGLAGTSALLTTLVVLATQNRQAQLAERREQLDLEISLLIEQKVAKVVALVEELRRDLPNVRDREDLEAEKMSSATNAHDVIEELNRVMEEAVLEATGKPPFKIEDEPAEPVP